MDSRYNTDHKYTKRDEERRSRKLFIGGVSFSTNDEDFFKYFAKYGELEDCVLIREKDTGQSRGFGFVTYKDKEVSHHVAQQQLYLDGRRLDPKPSISRYSMDEIHEHRNQTTKVFVGGLHDDTAEAELSEHFCGFGEVLEVNIMYDRFTNAPRGFGFVTFKEPDVANKVIHWDKDHMIHGKKVDCKPATARKDAFKRDDNERVSAPVYDKGKSNSREERWRKYHGDAEHGGVAAYGHHGVHSSYATAPPTHSSYAHHGVHAYAQPHAYPAPSHTHSSYAHPPPPPQAYYDTPQAQAQYAPPTHYDPYYRHDARYAHYPPPAHAQAPAQVTTQVGGTEYKYAPQQPAQQTHYPNPPPSTAQAQVTAQVQPQTHATQVQATVGSSVTHAAVPRYDYYAQYVPPNGTQVGQGVVKKDGKSVVLAPPAKPIQSGGHTQQIQQTQQVPSSYGPSRGSKATNSAQGARYSAY